MGTKRDRAEENGLSPQTFEQVLSQLEAVVHMLEDGQIGLDESLAKYEEGVKLLKSCRESLRNVEQKITLLTGIDADGNPVVEPFTEEAASLEEKKEARTRRRSRASTGASPEHSEPAADLDAGDRQKGLF